MPAFLVEFEGEAIINAEDARQAREISKEVLDGFAGSIFELTIEEMKDGE